MRLLLLNDSYFGDSLKADGVEVLRVGPGKSNDIQINPETDDLADVIASSGFEPDSILQVDSIDQRVFFKGLEKLEVPKAFYAIDAPINEFWQKHYSHLFDRVWVDQHDVWKKWYNEGMSWVRWLPLAADENIFYADETERDIPVVFVGTLDHDRRPKRSAILYRLKQITDVEVVHGDGKRSVPAEEVANYYRKAKIVLNELLFDGINLRTFEAMACGAVVLTEGNRGEERLFQDGKEIACFDPSSLEQVVSDLLSDDQLRKEIGDEGAQKVSQNHTVKTRAMQVLKKLEKLEKREVPDQTAQRIEILWGMLQAGLKWEYFNELKVETVNELGSFNGNLDSYRKAVIEEIQGNVAESHKILMAEYQKGNPSPYLRVTLALSALRSGNLELTRELLNSDAGDAERLQLEIGNSLLGLGHDLTPGINRMNSPVLQWNAFEHFNYLFSNNEDSLPALQGLDKVLTQHNSTEFTLGLWQKFHLRNPKDLTSRKMLMERAKSGYFLPGKVRAKREENSLPLAKDSRRSGERMLSSGQTRSV